MNPEFYGLIEMALSFGLIVVFGVWQLRSLASAKKKLEARRADEEKSRES